MSTQEDYIRRVIGEQRNRVVAGLMDHFEKNVLSRVSDPRVRKMVHEAYRTKVITSTGQYHDTVLDLVKAIVPDEGLMINEGALDMLAQIHAAVIRG